MTLRLIDLLADGLRMMIRLDDGLPYEDSVGLQADDLKLDDMGALDRVLTILQGAAEAGVHMEIVLKDGEVRFVPCAAPGRLRAP